MRKIILGFLLSGSSVFGQAALPATPQPQHFFNKTNIALMAVQAGGHVWAAKEYNGIGYTYHEVAEDDYKSQRLSNFGFKYAYAKEFSQMGATVALSYIAHRTGHRKLARWILAGDITFSYAQAYRYRRQYDDLDCQIGSLACKHGPKK